MLTVTLVHFRMRELLVLANFICRLADKKRYTQAGRGIPGDFSSLASRGRIQWPAILRIGDEASRQKRKLVINLDDIVTH